MGGSDPGQMGALGSQNRQQLHAPWPQLVLMPSLPSGSERVSQPERLVAASVSPDGSVLMAN